MNSSKKCTWIRCQAAGLPVQDSTREVVRSTVGVILNSQNLARIIWYLYDMYHVGNAVFVETVFSIIHCIFNFICIFICIYFRACLGL